jgi:hypothetical protein
LEVLEKNDPRKKFSKGIKQELKLLELSFFLK